MMDSSSVADALKAIAEGSWQQWLVRVGVTIVVLFMTSYAMKVLHHLSPKKPPGPFPIWPVLGNLPLVGTLPHRNFYEMAKKYGDIMELHLGGSRTVVISSPALLKEVCKDKDQIFASRPPNVAGKIIMYGRKDIVWSPYGSHWRHMRKVCVLELFTAKRLDSSKPIRQDEFAHLIDDIYRNGKGGKPVNMQTRVSDTAMNVVTRMMLKRRYFTADAETTEEAVEFKELVVGVMHLVGVFNLSDFIPFLKPFDVQGYQAKMKDVHLRMDKFLDRCIQQHLERKKKGEIKESERDFVDVMLTLPGEEKGSERLEDCTIKAMINEVICAGTDTSAVTMEWGLVQLIKHPSAMKKAQDELDNVIGKDRVVTEDDLQSLPYLQAIVKETFRLHPPAPLLVPHFSNEDTEIGGYKIAANTRVFINAWAVQRHPSAYEDPLEFKPDRFVGSGVDVRGTDYQLVPFGTGRRSCPAMPLGTIMVQLGLSRLLQAFDWSLPNGEDPKDIDMDEIFGITVPKRIPLHAIATPRLPAHLYAYARV